VSFRSLLVVAALALCAPPLAAGVGRAAPVKEVDLANVSPFAGMLKRVYGSVGEGNFGVPVAGGFDCDGDGQLDLAMAAMTADPLGRTRAGQVFLVFGDGTTGGTLDSSQDQGSILRILGDQPSENVGSEIWMDDVTGDGVGDLLIARQNHTPAVGREGAGALTILVGGPALRSHAQSLQALDLRSPPAGITLMTIVGDDAVDRLGIWVRTGDITGDGIADLVLGADQDTVGLANHRGAVYVVRGGVHLAVNQTIDLADFGTTALAGHLLRITPPSGSNEYHFGATCQIADLDGNGRGEVLVAAALNRAGASLNANGAPSASHANGGSTDGTLFIAWDDEFTGVWPAGYSFDITAATSSTEIDGGVMNREFGEEILGGLDYDDDGEADLFVGDITGDGTVSQSRLNSGMAHVFYDAAGLRGLSFDLDSPPMGVSFSTFLGAASGHIAGDTAAHGDFDGDGIADLAFSAPHADPLGRTNAGQIYVFHGQATPWPSLVDLAAEIPSPPAARVTMVYGAHGSEVGDVGDVLCYSAAAADIDGDGRVDLISNEMLGNGIAPGSGDAGNLIVLSGALFVAPLSLPSLGSGALAGLCFLLAMVAVRVLRRARICCRMENSIGEAQ